MHFNLPRLPRLLKRFILSILPLAIILFAVYPIILVFKYHYETLGVGNIRGRYIDSESGESNHYDYDFTRFFRQTAEETNILSADEQSLLFDSEHVWKRRSRTEIKSNILRMIADLHPKEQRMDDVVEPPVIVLGTAGTGTRVVHDLLVTSGVQMSHIVNPQRDSLAFIILVKGLDALCQPKNRRELEKAAAALNIPNINGTRNSEYSSAFESCLIKWIAESGRMDYDIDDIKHHSFYEPLKQGVDRLATILQSEALLRRRRAVTKPFFWGFKESQAMFVLPLLLQRFRRQSKRSSQPSGASKNRLSIVHIVRDGRDIAFSKQQRRKFQMHYVNLMKQRWSDSLNRTNLMEEDQFAVDVARTWQFVNEGVYRWAERHSPEINYVWVRLEDICRPHTRLNTTMRILRALGKSPPYMKRFKSSIERMVSEERCNLAKYQSADPELVRNIERVIQSGLGLFGYDSAASRLQSVGNIVDGAATGRNSKGLLEDYVRELNSQHPGSIALFVHVTKSYYGMFFNWLKHLLAATKDRTAQDKLPVLIHTNHRSLFNSLTSTECNAETDEFNSILRQAQSASSTVRLLPLFCQEESCGGEKLANIWRWRIEIVRSLIQAGVNLVLTDLDAIWVHDLLRINDFVFNFTADTRLQPLNNPRPLSIWNYFDIVASRGRYPYELERVWGGATVCMGWVYLRAGKRTEQLMQLASDYIEQIRDDQKAFNFAINTTMAREGTDWSTVAVSRLISTVPSAIANIGKVILPSATATDAAVNQTDKNLSILLLPFSVIPRYCKDDMKELAGNTVADSVIRVGQLSERLYPQASVIHCYLTGRNVTDKFRQLYRYGMWNLSTLAVEDVVK